MPGAMLTVDARDARLAAHDPFALLGRTAHSRIVEPPFGCVLLGTEEKKIGGEEKSLRRRH